MTARDFTEQIILKTPDMELVVRGAATEWVADHLLVWTEHYGEFLVHKDEVSEFHTKPYGVLP